MDTSRDSAWPWVLALAAVAAVLRAINLNSDLWIDEIYALVETIRPSLGFIVTNYPADTHHPLYSIFAHIAVSVGGESPWLARLPAVLFGVATIPALYLLGRQVGSRAEALAACAILAVSYHHVWFSQNARGYSALALFAILCAYALLRGIEEGGARWFALYAVFIALGAYTHLTLVFMAFAHALVCAWLTFGPARARHIRDWRLPMLAFGGGAALTVLLYLPMLDGVLWWFLERPSQLLGVSTPSWALVEGLRVLALGLGVPPLLLLAAAVIAGTGVVSYWRQNAVIVWVFLLPVAGTLAGALLARGTMYPRFFFYLAGFLLLIGVRGILVTGEWLGRILLPARLQRHRTLVAYAMIAVVCAASVRSLRYNYSFPKQNYSAAIAYIEQRGANETVVVAGPDYPFTRYFALPWRSIAGIAELEQQRAAGLPFWVIYMQPRYIEKDAPGLVAAIESSCVDRSSFHGTLGGGDIHVCRIAPPAMSR